MTVWPIWLILGVAGAAAQLDLDCAAPERARALIEYAKLSEIEQVEDIHRDALDKALARCQAGAGREACRAERRRQADLEWERKLAEIKARYDKMHKDFEERCRASIARASEAMGEPSHAGLKWFSDELSEFADDPPAEGQHAEHTWRAPEHAGSAGQEAREPPVVYSEWAKCLVRGRAAHSAASEEGGHGSISEIQA